MKEKEVAGEKKKVKGTPPGGRARPPIGEAVPMATGHWRRDGQRYTRPQAYELKRQAVRLYLEEGIPGDLVAQELGVSTGTIFDWVRQYREGGEAGLKPKPHGYRTLNTPKAVTDKIVALKRENPHFGVKRISQVLRRLFFLKASPKLVRKHLKRTGLVLPKPKARRKPEPPERRFEASTPNQMWQSDITYFPILGKAAYIVGFIDDHSRYITSLGVYRSQTSENVVETYRMATGELGAPKEMLTDNGRQYASWRGTTKFQLELKKDHVHHIRSAPHHPMTLGKIERFWQTLKDEFLERARFETFEEARERIAYWVKYYNHKRPHQGLEGMCPADRFFQIQKDLRDTIERHVAANVEEMALRGKPMQPFYMVGRVGEKSVVIETDKKSMSVRVDGRELNAGQGMVYELKEGVTHETGTGVGGGRTEAAGQSVQREGKEPSGAGAVEREAECVLADEGTGRGLGGIERVGAAGDLRNAHGAGPDLEATGGGTAQTAHPGGKAHGTDSEPGAGAGGIELTGKETHHEDPGTGPVWGGGQVPGGVDGVDGAEEGVEPVPGDGSERLPVLAVAGPGGIGYVGSIGAAGNERGREGAGAAGAVQAPAGSQSPVAGPAEPGAERHLAHPSGERQTFAGNALDGCGLLTEEVSGVDRGTGSESGREDAGDPGSPGRDTHSHAGGPGSRGEPQDVLRVAGASDRGDALGVDGPAGWPSAESGGPGEGAASGRVEKPGEGAGSSGRSAEDPGSDPADIRGTAERVVAA
jgi:transposase InsO family protein